MEKIRVFVGNCNDCYATTYTNGKVTILGDSISIKNRNIYDVLFEGLIDILRKLKDVELVYYSNDDSFAFEWEREFKENKLDKSNPNYNKWLKVMNLCTKNKIKLNIKGDSDVLAIVGKLRIKNENR